MKACNDFVLQVNDDPATDGGEVIHPSIVDQKPNLPPLASSYNDKIRPLLDAIDKLRRLNVTEEGIALPTIVVVGDQSAGKSSVLESLAGISLPRGQGICTRVPLVMRLQHQLDPSPDFILEFQKESVKIQEEKDICEAIEKATVEIAGDCKGVSNVPLTLVVKKRGIPDLTMVDLPGIARVAVGDQPQNIYEQISDMIMRHIKPEESIILNVLQASQDFATCESICMSRRVDITGERTLAVVTKCDQSPDGLHEKVMSNDVNIGLGYICVRNRINDETYDEARMEESKLFETHHLLSKISKSMVGIPVLAARLVEIQSVMMSKCFPDIVKKTNDRLNASVLELNKLPRSIKNIPDATAVFMRILGSFKESLKKILITGEFDEYMDDKHMHCSPRMVEMLNEFSEELHKSVKFCDDFLVEEMELLKESNGIWLPNFLPRSVFLSLLHKKVNSISDLPISFVNKVWGYLETICVRVLVDQCENYPQLLPSMRKATENVLAKTKDHFKERVSEMIQMEKTTDYTCVPEFIASWNKLMGESRDDFLKVLSGVGVKQLYVEGYGWVEMNHLVGVPQKLRDEAFDLKMRMTSYWNIVLKRMVDSIALKLQFLIQKAVNDEMEREIVIEVVAGGGGLEKCWKNHHQ